MIKILLVEDDLSLSNSVFDFLDDFADVMQVFDGDEGLYEAESGVYDLILLDLMLPEKDGFTVLRELRDKGVTTPVLIMTAKESLDDKGHGFELGADDYLTKPFEITEFTARVLSLIRRYTRFNPKNEEPQQLSFKGLLIDLDQHTVTTNGEPMLLPPKEFGVLLYCARHQGKILTKQQIYEAVWGEPYVYDDSNIMAIISRLRKKIELDPSSPIYLQTIKGIGYQFNTEV